MPRKIQRLFLFLIEPLQHSEQSEYILNAIGKNMLHVPTVTIGLPVYNGEEYLAQAIDSLLAQTFQDFELVISDNGSTDQTQAICERYMAADQRIRYVRSPVNRGAAWNYNHVFALAQGKYFRWTSHDDLCAPTHLERCVAILKAKPEVVLCYPKSLFIDEAGDEVRKHEDGMNFRAIKPHERLQDFLPGACNPIFGLIRMDALKTTSLIGSYVGSDEILLWQLVLRGQFYEVPEYLFYRRYHPRSSVRANPDYRSRTAWFDPTNKQRFHFPRWHHFFRRIVSIHQTPLAPYEKLLCYIEMGKPYLLHPGWIRDDFVVLFQELMQNEPMKKKDFI